MITSKKAALIIGHPGHELRAFKYIKDFKPDVYILTDGSGSTNNSRLHQSVKVIKQVGANFQQNFPSFTDKELYNIILEKKLEKIIDIKKKLKQYLVENEYDLIVGDALEGFNPTHDTCRYLINSVVSEVSAQNGKSILNYDFLLDESPNNLSTENNKAGFSLQLTHEEFDQKLIAAENYPELKYEVEYAINRFGRDSFLWESFRKVTDEKQIFAWKSEVPYYESFGRKRVEDGIYKNVITFEDHLKPIAKAVMD